MPELEPEPKPEPLVSNLVDTDHPPAQSRILSGIFLTYNMQLSLSFHNFECLKSNEYEQRQWHVLVGSNPLLFNKIGSMKEIILNRISNAKIMVSLLLTNKRKIRWIQRFYF